MSRTSQDPRGALKSPNPLRRFLAWILRPLRRLFAPDPSVAQVMAEWVEYQMIFQDILTRLSAHLARQAQQEKKRLRRIQEHLDAGGAPPAPNGPQPNRKAMLRRRLAEQRGLALPTPSAPAASPVLDLEEDE